MEQMQNQMDPVYTPARKIHLYHCDHRGLPLALISTEGATAWCAEYDEWGNLLNEENRISCSSLSACRGSSMMRSPACITTATAIMTRCRGGISLRIRLG
ncbi:RHS family protein [Escherichia coli DEC15C]|nr:RHS family protein [Escherichia coli DEC15C]